MKERKRSRRALIIRYEGYPFAVRMSKVLMVLIECGFDVDVLIPEGREGTPTYTYRDGSALKDLVRVHTFRVQDNFFWRAASYLDKSMMLKDLEFETALTDLLAGNDYDLISVKDSHRLKPVFQILEKLQKKNVPVVCDMYENVVEQARDYRIRFAEPMRRAVSRATLLPQRLEVMEANCLPLCDRIFVVVDEMRRYLMERYRLDGSRISVVENVEPLAYFDSISSDDSLFDSIATQTRVVSYVGSINTHRGLDTFLDAVSLLTGEQRKKTVFVIVGARDRKRQEIERKAESLGIADAVDVYGYVSHDDAMRWIRRSQIGVIPHADTPFIRTTVPNKLFQYMAAGALVVSSDVGPLGRIVRDSDCGLVFKAGDARAMADRLCVALADDRLIAQKGRKGRLAAEKKYNWERQSVEYSDYFNGLRLGGEG